MNIEPCPTFSSSCQAIPRVDKFDEFRIVNPHARLLANANISEIIDNETIKRNKEGTIYELVSFEDAVLNASGFSDFSEIEAQLRTHSFSSIVVSHEGSVTGAPVVCANLCRSLSNNNILISFGSNQVFTSLSDDTLLLNFVNQDRRTAQWGFILGSWLLEKACLSEDLAIIGSTIESSSFISGLCLALDKGACTLLHEHAQYYEVSRLEQLLASSQTIVYSSEYVKSSWLKALSHDCDGLISSKNLVILPQPIPSNVDHSLDNLTKNSTEVVTHALRICGAGHVQPRKGVHLFLELCREVAVLASAEDNLSLEVIWIGMPKEDTEYSQYIMSKARSLSRNVANLNISLLPTDPSYLEEIKKCDLFVCPSTVDPLPNIVYDAICVGVPAFIFSMGNGHAEYYRKFGLDMLILDQNNLKSSAESVFSFWINSQNRQNDVLLKYKKLLYSYPSQEEYSERILSLARQSSKLRAGTLRYISKTVDFSMSAERLALGHFPFSPPSQVYNNALTARQLLDLWGYKRLWLSASEAKYSFLRCFLKLVGPSKNKLSGESTVNKVAKDLVFVFRQPSTSFANSNVAPQYDIHLHAYYPDAAIANCNFFRKLAHRPNNVVITFVNEETREIIENASPRDLNLHFIKVANIGRNLLPILSACSSLSSPYTIHLHTKKSLHSSADMVEKWTSFLFDTLFGDDCCSRLSENLQMMESSQIDFAYPLDPNVQWIGRNADLMNEIILRMKLNGLIDVNSVSGSIAKGDQIPYPCGYMFIAKTKFLKDVVYPVLNLLSTNEIQEPLPYDGTMLHALERLTPLLATLLDKRIALLVPGPNVSR